MDSRGRVAADIALACVVAAFLVAGAAFTASAVLGPRPALDVAVPAAASRGGAFIADAPSGPRPGHQAAGPVASSRAPSSGSQPSGSASATGSGSQPSGSASATPLPRPVARAATSPSNDGGPVQAGGDIHAGDGAGDHDGN